MIVTKDYMDMDYTGPTAIIYLRTVVSSVPFYRMSHRKRLESSSTLQIWQELIVSEIYIFNHVFFMLSHTGKVINSVRSALP